MNIFGKVAVLYGGISSEREISIITGKNVLQALLNKNIDAYALDVNKENIVIQLQTNKPDRAFIALHGQPLGEDGLIQSLLEIMNIPYTGSGVLASAIVMDKEISSLLWQKLGLPIIPFLVFENDLNVGSI